MNDQQKRGRPATERGAYNPHPPRQLGRVSDEDWGLLKEAAEASGTTFTDWAVPSLLKLAAREKKKRGSQMNAADLPLAAKDSIIIKKLKPPIGSIGLLGSR